MSKNKNTPVEKVESSNDLDQLRNILYGNQARATEQRLEDLEQRVENVNADLKKSLKEKFDALTHSTGEQFSAVQELLAKTNADLNKNLEQQISNLSKQLSDFKAESRQRDADVRQEMLALGAMLDKQKTGRLELGDLLINLGQQLKDNREIPDQND